MYANQEENIRKKINSMYDIALIYQKSYKKIKCLL